MTTLLERSASSEPLHVDLCRAEFGAGYLWLQYRVSPVPEPVRHRPRACDLPCGEATVDGVPLEHCSATYRVGLDQVHIDGVLAVGPLPAHLTGRVGIRFAPLAGVPGCDAELCVVDLDVIGGVVVDGCSQLIR